jgi:deoxyuridine 5'-triphosphate nucleotidohydrolase
MDNDTLSKFMAIMNLEDKMFDAMYPEFSANFKASIQNRDKTIRDQIIQQMRNIPEINVDEEKASINDAIKEVQEDNSLSENKRAFLCDILKVIRNTYIDAIENPREKIDVGIEVINPNGQIPTYAHTSDAGADVTAAETISIPANETIAIGTGLRLNIPKGYEVQVRPRSGLSLKTGLRVANAPGTVDSGYRGELKILLHNTSTLDYTVNVGDKIA